MPRCPTSKRPGAFNAHNPGDGGSGLVQPVFRSPARIPSAESTRKGLCTAPPSEKRYTFRAMPNATRARTAEEGPKHLPLSPHSRTSRGRLPPHCGFLWCWRLLPGSPLRSRRIEGIFGGLACVEPHCFAGCDLDGLAGLRIPPLACRPRRHIESAKSGDTDRIPSHEGIENGVHYGLNRLAGSSLV